MKIAVVVCKVCDEAAEKRPGQHGGDVVAPEVGKKEAKELEAEGLALVGRPRKEPAFNDGAPERL